MNIGFVLLNKPLNRKKKIDLEYKKLSNSTLKVHLLHACSGSIFFCFTPAEKILNTVMLSDPSDRMPKLVLIRGQEEALLSIAIFSMLKTFSTYGKPASICHLCAHQDWHNHQQGSHFRFQYHPKPDDDLLFWRLVQRQRRLFGHL